MEGMGASDRARVLRNMQLAFELFKNAEAMMRHDLRRKYSSESDTEIEERLLKRLRERSSAPNGDGAGTVRSGPKTSS